MLVFQNNSITIKASIIFYQLQCVDCLITTNDNAFGKLQKLNRLEFVVFHVFFSSVGYDCSQPIVDAKSNDNNKNEVGFIQFSRGCIHDKYNLSIMFRFAHVVFALRSERITFETIFYSFHSRYLVTISSK